MRIIRNFLFVFPVKLLQDFPSYRPPSRSYYNNPSAQYLRPPYRSYIGFFPNNIQPMDPSGKYMDQVLKGIPSGWPVFDIILAVYVLPRGGYLIYA